MSIQFLLGFWAGMFAASLIIRVVEWRFRKGKFRRIYTSGDALYLSNGTQIALYENEN
jgi:hypothetical protein